MSYEKLPIAEHDSLQKNYSSFEQNHSEVTLSFHDLHYEVSKKMDDAPVCGKTAMVEILSGVSGWLPPGLNAIMGPTGSGKSSLLDILAQRKNPKGLKEGLVLLNGEKPPKDFRLMSGYVVQDDIVMGTLTVRENLTFSANLRLSNKQYNKTARKAKVEEVIIQLGLEACADTLVGTEFVRGVSGGERKRVNIGMEMILDPPVLFMDEPTTGLDSNTANSIMLLLHKLSSGGRNIIISIHQPRYSIFSLFDRLIILNKGQIVYRGPAKISVNYFRDIGYICPRFLNPADFFLDIVGSDVSTAKLLNRLKSGASSDEAIDQAECETTSISVESDGAKNNTMHLLEEFQKSEITKEENEKLAAIQNSFYSQQNSPGDEYDALKASYSNGFFVQLNSVVRRTVLNILRNPMTSFVQLIMTMVFGILIGIIYFKMDTSFQSGLQNRSGIFFFLITSQVMSNLSALEIFILNRSYFIHESASGYYRVSVFFIAQVFADLIPNRLIPQLFFCTVVYFMAGFQLSVAKFFIFTLTISTTAICASSMAFMVSASVRVSAVANIVVALPYTMMMLFGGFLVNTNSLLDWLAWIKYISIFRYGTNALTVNEMSGLIFIDNSSYPGFNRSSEMPCISTINHALIPNCTTGEMFMKEQGIEYGIWGLWKNVLALAMMAVGFLLLAYIQLRRINKFK